MNIGNAMLGGVAASMLGTDRWLGGLLGGAPGLLLADKKPEPKSAGGDDRQRALAAALSSTMAPQRMQPQEQAGGMAVPMSPVQGFAGAAEPLANHFRQKRIAELLASRQGVQP